MLSYCTTAEMLWVKGHHVHHGTHRDLRVLPRNKATHAYAGRAVIQTVVSG